MSDGTASSAGIARNSKQWIWVYLACAAAVLAYSRIVGPVAFIGDSLYLCDPAKYFAGRFLPGGESLFFFYRPLVSLLWMPAYFFQRPEEIVLAIQGINALVYAASIWPLLLLWRGYASLTAGESLAMAFIFALGPCALIYAPMLLTEAVYAPVFLFLVLSTWQRIRRPGLRWDVACGLLIGLCYLSRHAGSIVPVAWAMAEGTRLIRRGQDWKTRFMLIKSAAIVVAVSAIPIGSWMGVEHYLKKETDGGAGATLLVELAGNHDHALAWAGNLIQYLLWSPAGFVILLGTLVFLASPSFFLRDTTAVFVFATVTLAVVSTVLFQGSHWGDQSLTLNRYLAPYVAPLSIVCWRYAQDCRRGCIVAALVIAAVLWLLGFPESLNTHFPDYLAWAKLISSQPDWQKLSLHVLLGVGMALGLICFWRRWRLAAISVLVLFTFVWDVGATVFWRNFSANQIQPALQNASKVWAATRQDHATLAVDDRTRTAFDRDILLFLCFYPDQLPEMTFGEVLDKARENHPVRLITRSRASVGKPFASAAPAWEFPGKLPAGKESPARIQAFGEKDLAYLNVSSVRQRVLLAGESVSLEVECAGAETAVELEMKVISPKAGRTLSITDSTGVSQFAVQIPSGTLKKGWGQVKIPLKLQPGTNLIKLSVDGPMASLGRRTARLIISERIDIRLLANPPH